MIAVDTNVLVRFLTCDEKQQFKKAFALFEAHDIFIPDTVILELEWVLRYAYSFTPDEISNAFHKLFGLSNVHVTNPALIALAIQWHTHGLDFADAFHLALSQQYGQFFTFDSKLVRKAKNLGTCSVSNP
jgi:predicted nucleic-acid-binding protein